MTIGFALVTHDNPAGAARLIGTLDRMFGDPPIAWHHDFSKCPDMPRDGWPGNTRLITPHIVTEYCRWPCIQAIMAAIENLYVGPAAPRPDWFFLLSGVCFPIKPAHVIREVMSRAQASGVDAFAAHEFIHPDHVSRVWHYECLRRYCERKIHIPWITKRLMPTRKPITVRWPDFGRPFFPFSKARPCYAGPLWVSGNARAADSLFRTMRDWPAMVKHFSRVWTPEEVFFQTAWKADPSLRIENYTHTYVHFERETDQRPKVLTPSDLPAFTGRPELFARKVSGELADVLAKQVV